MPQKNTKPTTTNKTENKLLSALLISAAVSLGVALACFTYLSFVERPSISELSIKAQAQSLADSQAAILNQALHQLKTRLTKIASSKELLIALDKQDPAIINQYKIGLDRAFPETLSNRLIILGPLGIASLNKEKSGVQNNIELDLLRRISNGDTVEPEAYRLNDQWVFSLVQAIKYSHNKHASGALIVTLSEQYLLTLLSHLDNSLGQTKLIQQFNNKQHLIAATGNRGEEKLAVHTDTRVSYWQIQFMPSAELIAKSSHGSMLLWIMFALIAAAILSSSLVAFSTLKNALENNLLALEKVSGQPPVAFSLPGFAARQLQLQQKMAIASESKATTSADTEAHAKETKPSPTSKPVAAKTQQLDDKPTLNLPKALPENIFRAYDIRGLADTELTNPIVYAIGLAIGSEALDQGQQSVIVSADGRHSSPRILDSLMKGLQDSGRDVIDIGILPTPLMYFATHQLGTQSGVMITGSHNPAEYNGIKIVIGGRALSGPAIQALKNRILNKQVSSGKGSYQTESIERAYIDYIINDIAIAQPLKVVLDAGNGVTGTIAPQLFEELGCEVVPLFCDVDGDFPNHHPDPSVEANLEDLKRVVNEQHADLGIAFDGDGDRLGVVTASGQSVAADRLLMLFAQDVVSRNPGADVIFDVKCTRNLNHLISNYGGRPIMWKTGHSLMKDKMMETGALLGGELSGHIFFKERWFGFDDGMYAAARLIEILSTSDPDLDVQLDAFPHSFSSPELKIESTDAQKFVLIDQLIQEGDFGDGKISTLDGLRVDFANGWGLVRASNTTPMLILRFEADDEPAMQLIQEQFKVQLSAIDNSLQFGF